MSASDRKEIEISSGEAATNAVGLGEVSELEKKQEQSHDAATLREPQLSTAPSTSKHHPMVASDNVVMLPVQEPSTAAQNDAPVADERGMPSPPPQREMRVFRPTDVPFDPRRVELPDDFYAATAADVKVSLEKLSGVTRSMNDAPLMTKKLRDAEQAKKMSRFRKVLIRVRLPDRTALQGTFTPSSTVRDVVKFVNAALRDPKVVKFYLFLVPPKTILKNLDATLWSLGLVPAALIYLGLESGTDDSSSLLSDSALSLLEDTPLPGAMVYSSTAPPVTGNSASSGTGESDSSGGSAKPVSDKPSSKFPRKIPKWLKK
jgi:tether containing UBX domain for GLUT4